MQVSRIVPTKSPYFPAFARSRRQAKTSIPEGCPTKNTERSSCADDSAVLWNGDDNDDDDNVGDNTKTDTASTPMRTSPSMTTAPATVAGLLVFSVAQCLAVGVGVGCVACGRSWKRCGV